MHLNTKVWERYDGRIGYDWFLGWAIYLVASFLRRKQQDCDARTFAGKICFRQDFATFVQSPVGQKYGRACPQPSAARATRYLAPFKLALCCFSWGLALIAVSGNTVSGSGRAWHEFGLSGDGVPGVSRRVVLPGKESRLGEKE